MSATPSLEQELTRLEEAERAARDRSERLREERLSFERAQREAFTAKLKADTEAMWGDLQRAADIAHRSAVAARDEARERAAAGRERTIPLGTIMVEWAFPSWRMYSADQSPKPTGKKGVLEVITADSEHPGNLPTWSWARRGDVVIRILKKDGKPGKAYVCKKRDMDHWRPEGHPYTVETTGEEG